MTTTRFPSLPNTVIECRLAPGYGELLRQHATPPVAATVSHRRAQAQIQNPPFVTPPNPPFRCNDTTELSGPRRPEVLKSP